MATLFEHQTSSNDWTTMDEASGVEWLAQPFVASSTHTVTSIKIRGFRASTPGNITVSLYSTSGGNPSSSLTSGTIDGNAVTTVNTGTVTEATMAVETTLTSGVTYAVVMNGPGTGPSANFACNGQGSSGFTPTSVRSTNSGSTWASNGQPDAFYFEIYGNAISGPTNLKTVNGLAKASVKTINGLALASVKTYNGLT